MFLAFVEFLSRAREASLHVSVEGEGVAWKISQQENLDGLD